METVKVSEVLNGQTTVSKKNSKVWESFMKIMDSKGKDEEVLFDFRGVDINEPWTNVQFQQFIKDERVYMKLYSSSREAETINQSCLIAGVKGGRCMNEDMVVEKGPTSEQIKLRRYIDRFDGWSTLKDGVLVFDYCYETVTEKIVYDAIEGLIERHRDKIKKVVLNFKSAVFQPSMFEYLAQLNEKLSKKYELDMKISDKQSKSYADAFISTHDSSHMSELDKLKLFESCIAKDTAGVLTVYKKSKKKDALGRCGDGEILFTRPAIYRGMTKGPGGVINLNFEAFKGNKFFRKLDYELDNGGHKLEKLESEMYTFSIDEVGVCDKMKGTLAHFNNPITLDESDMYTVYKIDGNNMGTTKKTLPQYMKIVLDDHNINYNQSALLKCISVNKLYLDKKRNGEI